MALTAAANEVDRFLGVPIIVFGSEFPDHALHIGEALIGQGSNFKPISPALNRTPAWPRGWYNRAPECDRKSRDAYGASNSGKSAACDEFPFATTRQGGPVNYVLWGVSLRLLDLNESSRTGGFIDSFYGTAMISPDGISRWSRFVALGIPGSKSFFTDRMGRVHYWSE
ncbi:NucA/NucB deoxyribonuclease domain-containing protein [Tahibacter caeni]|uniref:NucA/NucB deoxyribonuclease domain-containing protein n=1 Tax=Tahibacter caeni TaxID=1453545 RepID=UPI003CCD905B